MYISICIYKYFELKNLSRYNRYILYNGLYLSTTSKYSCLFVYCFKCIILINIQCCHNIIKYKLKIRDKTYCIENDYDYDRSASVLIIIT